MRYMQANDKKGKILILMYFFSSRSVKRTVRAKAA